MEQCQFSGDSGKRKHDPQETVMERHEKKNKIKNEWICSVLHILVSEPTLLNFQEC